MWLQTLPVGSDGTFKSSLWNRGENKLVSAEVKLPGSEVDSKYSTIKNTAWLPKTPDPTPTGGDFHPQPAGQRGLTRSP